jgi:hypothetical protein
MLATGQGEITGQDLRHAEFVNRADLLIHDAQYTAEEYPAKVGWGHSTVEYVVTLGRFAQVKSVALTHHDPLRDDDAIDRLVANVRAGLRENASSLDVFAAAEGQIVEVAASPTKSAHPLESFGNAHPRHWPSGPCFSVWRHQAGSSPFRGRSAEGIKPFVGPDRCERHSKDHRRWRF